jgi:hypothetical protein
MIDFQKYAKGYDFCMYGILFQFRSSKAEEIRARAHKMVENFKSVPGFKGITFFNDLHNDGDNHGFLLYVESKELANALLQQIESTDRSSIEAKDISIRTVEVFPFPENTY